MPTMLNFMNFHFLILVDPGAKVQTQYKEKLKRPEAKRTKVRRVIEKYQDFEFTLDLDQLTSKRDPSWKNGGQMGLLWIFAPERFF